MDDRRVFDARERDTARAVARIEREFREGFELVNAIDRPAVTIFGSARIGDSDPLYRAARTIGRAFAEQGWAVITGGGPGLMEAANRGAQEAGGLSIGFGIRLPQEQAMNPYVDLAYTFEHFYARKVCFVKPAEGFVVLPGGFGTLDELSEALTLTQTRKTDLDPIVLFDSAYWSGLVDWIHASVLGKRLISAGDTELFHVTDDTGEAASSVMGGYGRRSAAGEPLS